MTGYVAQKQAGQKFAGGKVVNVPDKYCPICAAVFGSAPPEQPLKPVVCGLCSAKLKAGETALVCGNRYAFITSASLADMAGKIMNIGPKAMDAVEREYKGHVKTKPEDGTSGKQSSNPG